MCLLHYHRAARDDSFGRIHCGSRVLLGVASPYLVDLVQSSVSLVQRGAAAGFVATSALTGLLLGLGRRTGTAWRPLNAAAHTVLGARADDVWSFHGGVTPVGGLVVLTMSMAAGFAVARLAPSMRTLHVIGAAAGVALTGYLLHLHLAARTPGGLAALLSLGELRAFYLTLGVALWAGIRFAFLADVETHER